MRDYLFVPVDSFDLPDHVMVGSIHRESDDELVKYVPERTCEGCKHENKSKLNWPCVICTHINKLDYYEVSE